MRYLYSALLYISMPFILLRLLWRSRGAPQYRRRWSERFGYVPADLASGAPTLWLHAVSVGEVAAAAPLVEGLLRCYPHRRVLVTTTTPTGSEALRSRFGARVAHVYLPWDLPGAVNRFLDRVRPEALLLMETELWPNLLHRCRARGCRVLLCNGRMSAGSAARYRRFPQTTVGMLACIDHLACQGEADAARFHALGVPQHKLEVTGNLKFDCDPAADYADRIELLRRELNPRRQPVWIAASTHPGEEARVLDAYRQIRAIAPDCLLALVPRHPQRFDDVAGLCRRQGFTVTRRSLGEGAWGDILLGDTMGELPMLYGIAEIAFVGGSLVTAGGHNMLEAAAWGIPVLAGPHIENFQEVGASLAAAGALVTVHGAGELADRVLGLLQEPRQRAALGDAARQVLDANRGATDRVLVLLAAQLARGA